MTATTPGDELRAEIEADFLATNPYPWGSIDLTSRPKQSTRLVKAACPHCGYTVRVTRKWLDQAGAPICPVDNEPLEEA